MFRIALLVAAISAPTGGERVDVFNEYRIAHPATQLAMTQNSDALRRFEARYGDSFIVEWDERSGTPLRIYGKPMAFTDAPAFLATIDGLLAVPRTDLEQTVRSTVGDTMYLQFQRKAGGIEVWNAFVELRVAHGRVVLVKVDTHPGADVALNQPQLVAAPKHSKLVVLPVAHADKYVYRLAWQHEVVTASPPGRWLTHVDTETGQVLRRENLYRFVSGAVRGRVEPRTVGDTMEDLPMPFIELSFGGSDINANGAGRYDSGILDGTASVQLFGTYVNVNNQQGSDGASSFDTTASNDHTVTDSDASQAEIAAYRHTETVKAWARVAAPDLGWTNSRLTVNVNLSGSCNAYWNGTSTNFYRASNQCNNIARVSDVVYHEFGHGFHQNVRETGTVAGSIGEGSSDYVAVSITQDPKMAPGFFKSGDYLRAADNDKVYPDDLVGQVHADGEIWVGTMWDLMNLLQARYGAVEGRVVSDRLFADILRSGPRMSDLYAEALLADDNDGDLSNGTPHECEINTAFGNRGFTTNTGTPNFLPVLHDEVVGPIAADADITVTSTVGTVSACALSDADAANLFFSADRGATFSEASMLATSNPGEFAADITGLPDGTVVQYYLDAAQGSVTSIAPVRAPDNLYGFYVGKLDVIFADDFETDMGWTHGLDVGDVNTAGQDDWQRGRPQGKGGDPLVAYSGDHAWGNDLGLDGFNGLYQGDVKNWLSSPQIDCTACEGARLQYRRWLSVDKNTSDAARIYVNGELVWENSAQTEREDSIWTFHDVDISHVADGETIQLRFELETNADNNMGGWTIDDVTVVQPAASTGPGPGDDDDDDDGGRPAADNPNPFGCTCAVAPADRAPRSMLWRIALLAALAGLIAIRRRRRRQRREH